MYKGVAIWNYAGDAVENARRFKEAGFDAVSWNAPLFVERYNDDDRERVAEYLKESGQYLTMHNLLPDPDSKEIIEDCRKAWRILADWNAKHHLLNGMTFDFCFPHDKQLPLLREVMDVFRGTGVFLACEDTPLNARTMEKFAKYITPEDDYGILIDLGHMNVRQNMMEMHEPEDIMRTFKQLPLKLRELHLHSNWGRRDEHREVGYGNLPLKAVTDAAKEIGFDGIVTVEIVNSQQWTIDEHIAKAIDTSKRFFDSWNS